MFSFIFFFITSIARDMGHSHLIYSLRDVFKSSNMLFYRPVRWGVSDTKCCLDCNAGNFTCGHPNSEKIVVVQSTNHDLRDKMCFILFVFSPLNFRLKEKKTELGWLALLSNIRLIAACVTWSKSSLHRLKMTPYVSDKSRLEN